LETALHYIIIYCLSAQDENAEVLYSSVEIGAVKYMHFLSQTMIFVLDRSAISDLGFGFRERGQVLHRRVKSRGAAGVQSIWGGIWSGVPFSLGVLRWGSAAPQKMFLFWGFEMRILVHSPAHLSVCFRPVIGLYIKFRPPVRLLSLTFQAACVQKCPEIVL